MVRRALLTVFPLLLVALTFLSGTPSVPRSEAPAAAASSSAVTGPISVAHGDLAPDYSDGFATQLVDQDDDPDERIIRVAVAIKWSQSAAKARMLRADERAGSSHRTDASQPRAPPTA